MEYLPISEKRWNDEPVMVSVAVLAYNHGKYIAQALDSILAQRCDFRIEILINEDKSTDNTAEILRQYESKYPSVFRIVYQPENVYSKGIKPWCHILFPMARGKYIAICDGDDYWDDVTKLQKQVDFLEANPDYVVTYHDAKVVDGSGTLIKDSKLPDDRKRDFTSDEVMTGIFLLTVSMVFRNVLREFPSEIGTVANGDSFIISMLGQYGKGKYMTNVAPAVYRMHQGGVWGLRDNLKKSLSQRHTALQLMKFHERQGNAKAVAYFNKRYLQNSKQYFLDSLQAGEYRQFFKVYSDFLKTPASWKLPSQLVGLHFGALGSLFKSLAKS